MRKLLYVNNGCFQLSLRESKCWHAKLCFLVSQTEVNSQNKINFSGGLCIIQPKVYPGKRQIFIHLANFSSNERGLFMPCILLRTYFELMKSEFYNKASYCTCFSPTKKEDLKEIDWDPIISGTFANTTTQVNRMFVDFNKLGCAW